MRVLISAPAGPTSIPRIFDFQSHAYHKSQGPNFCTHRPLLIDQEFLLFNLMLDTMHATENVRPIPPP